MLKAYHTTTHDLATIISLLGLKPNQRPKPHSLPSYTELFNHFLAIHSWKFLPKDLKKFQPIDRDSAIFLSPFPDMYRKTRKSPMDDTVSLEDITFEINLDTDLPLFDSGVIHLWSTKVKEKINTDPLAKWYLGQTYLETKDQNFYKLIRYFMDEDFSTLDLPNTFASKSTVFENLRNSVIRGTNIYVRDYCQSGMLFSQIVDKYEPFEFPLRSGPVRVLKIKKSTPRYISFYLMPEILFHQPIPTEKIKRL